MVATISYNPMPTTNALGSFAVDFDGFIQGQAMDDPSARYRLRSGILSNNETIPMWGGVGINETTAPTPSGTGGFTSALPGSLGGVISRATQIAEGSTGLTGFSVFDQNYSALNFPQSPVPLVGSGMTCNFYPLGSNARVILAMDVALFASLEGNPVNQNVSWDFTLQRLVPYVATYPANVFTALTRALVSGSYVATATTTTSHGIPVGADFTVSGCVPAAYNGTWTAISGTTGSTLVWSLNTATDPGAETTLGQLNAGGGAVPLKILRLNKSNSMVVSYNPVTGYATWNRSGACAECQLSSFAA